MVKIWNFRTHSLEEYHGWSNLNDKNHLYSQEDREKDNKSIAKRRTQQQFSRFSVAQNSALNVVSTTVGNPAVQIETKPQIGDPINDTFGTVGFITQTIPLNVFGSNYSTLIINGDVDFVFDNIPQGRHIPFTIDFVIDTMTPPVINLDARVINPPTLPPLTNGTRVVLSFIGVRDDVDTRFIYLSGNASGSGGGVPSGTVENDHLEWNASLNIWEAVQVLSFSASTPLATTGYLRFVNDATAIGWRNAGDTGDLQFGTTATDFFEITNSGNGNVTFQIRAQHAVDADKTLLITQNAGTAGDSIIQCPVKGKFQSGALQDVFNYTTARIETEVNIIPNTDGTLNIGGGANRFNQVHASTFMFDGANGLYLAFSTLGLDVEVGNGDYIKFLVNTVEKVRIEQLSSTLFGDWTVNNDLTVNNNLSVEGFIFPDAIYFGELGADPASALNQAVLYSKEDTDTITKLFVRQSDGSIVGPIGTATNEFADDVFRIYDAADPTRKIAFSAAALTTGTIRTLTMLDEDAVVLGLLNIQTVSNKSFNDTTNYFIDAGDPTAAFQFDATQISTGTIRVYSMPNQSGNIPLKESSNVWSGTANQFTGTVFQVDSDNSVIGVNISDVLTINADTEFYPTATKAGLNVGSLAGDPSSPANGDIHYNSSTGKFRFRQAGAFVELGGSGSQTPWTSDIDADGFDLKDLSNIEFRASTSLPAGSVGFIAYNSTTELQYNALSGDFHSFLVGGTMQVQIRDDGEFRWGSGRAHRIVANNTDFQFLSENTTDEITFWNGTSRTNATVQIETDVTTWRTTTSETTPMIIRLLQNNDTPATTRQIGLIQGFAENSASTDVLYGQLEFGTASSVTSGSENGYVALSAMSNGSTVGGIYVGGSASGAMIGFFGSTGAIKQTIGSDTLANLYTALRAYGLIG